MEVLYDKVKREMESLSRSLAGSRAPIPTIEEYQRKLRIVEDTMEKLTMHGLVQPGSLR